MKGTNEKFSGKFAVITAMAGSAIGLGNIWRFPYMVGENGGAAFILIYVICSILIALPIFFAESIIGRRGGKDVAGSMEALSPGGNWHKVGVFCLLAPIIILSFYSVVGGWAIDYFIKALQGYFANVSPEDSKLYFSNFSSSFWAPLITHASFITITAAIVSLGVVKGIEKLNKIAVPALFFLIVLIAVYSISLPGAYGGVSYMVKPDFSKVSSGVVAAAMGQSFFSLSLGMGTITVYSSYMKKSESIPATGLLTVLFDTVFAILAGFAIMPAVFSAGIEPYAGPSLVFETLPYIFASMSKISPVLSYVVPILFFFTILLAAITSEISMFEVGTKGLMEEKHLSRRKACSRMLVVSFLLGLPCSLSFGLLKDFKLAGLTVFDIFDKSSSNILMFAGAFIFSVFVSWRMRKEDVYDEFTNNASLPGARKLFKPVYFWIKYVIPVLIVVVFITNLCM